MSTYETPIPGVDQYGTAELAAKTAYSNAVTRLNQQRQNTLQQYGYLGDIDPTSGTLSNLRVDPNNPYGQYQQLLRGSAQAGQQAHEAAVGRGLGGGLANQAEDDSRYAFGQGSFQLGTGLQGALNQYDTSQTGAAATRDQSIVSAQQNAAEQAIQQQQVNSQNALAARIQALQAAIASSSVAPSYDTQGAPPSVPYGAGGTPTTSNINAPTPATYGITYGPAAGKRASSNAKQGVYTVH